MEYEPKGIKFFDNASKKEMILVEEGQWAGWLVYKHPDGQWVSLRKANDVDKENIQNIKAGILGMFL